MGLFPVGHERLASSGSQERDGRHSVKSFALSFQYSTMKNKYSSHGQRADLHPQPSAVPPTTHPQTLIRPCFWSLHGALLYMKMYQTELLGLIFVIFVAADRSAFCFLRSWLSMVKQPLSHYLPLWTQKNMKSILHAFQAGKFCYWAYCFIMVSIIDIYELWNKT